VVVVELVVGTSRKRHIVNVRRLLFDIHLIDSSFGLICWKTPGCSKEPGRVFFLSPPSVNPRAL